MNPRVAQRGTQSSARGRSSAGSRTARAFAVVLACSVAACATPSPVSHAQELVRKHRETEAIGYLRKHLDKHPDDLGARRMLVRVLAFDSQLDLAREEVRELEKRMPGQPVPWIELGHAFELSHKFEEALAAYDEAARVAPSSPEGPREGGMRAARWGESYEARSRLEEAVRRGAVDSETFHALGLVRLHLRDFDGAVEAYEKGLVADPKSTENLLGLATVAIVRGDAAGALRAYDRVLLQRPNFASAELGRAWALARLGRRTDAERALVRAEELGAPRENIARQRKALAAAARPGDPRSPAAEALPPSPADPAAPAEDPEPLAPPPGGPL